MHSFLLRFLNQTDGNHFKLYLKQNELEKYHHTFFKVPSFAADGFYYFYNGRDQYIKYFIVLTGKRC